MKKDKNVLADFFEDIFVDSFNRFTYFPIICVKLLRTKAHNNFNLKDYLTLNNKNKKEPRCAVQFVKILSRIF